MIEETRTTYSFDRFTLDAHRRVLLNDGRTVQLTSKAFDLLLALVESAGREISKEELMTRVWKDQIVEDANLTVTMAQLRKVLGERAGDHRYVVTIPGRGYRFVGQLHHETASPEPISEAAQSFPVAAAVPPVSLDKKTSGRRRLLTVFALLVVSVAITITGYYTWTKRAPSAAAPQIKSIAVLPFKPLLAESRDEPLEMGMADTLIMHLSNNREISVRPFSSVRSYTRLDQDPIVAGREQRVDAVLDGQIQKAGEKIRVTVRLLRVGDGTQMWASKFDEKMTDIFSVQDSISERVTNALAMTLTTEEQRGLTKRHTTDAEAYQLYLKGRYQLNRLTDEGFFKGRDFFQQAIDKDPNYALAYAGLADAYNLLGGFDALPSNEAFPKAREAAGQALKLDDDLAEAHRALAMVQFSYDWNFVSAEREFRRTLEINPNYADAHQTFGYYLASMNRFDEALKEMKRALELEPLSVEKTAAIGEVLYDHRLYGQAVEQYRKALDMDSNSGFVHWALGRTFTAQGNYNEAIEELKKAIPLSGDSPDEPAELARAYALSGKRGEASKIIEELKHRSVKKPAPTVMAGIFAALGDKPQAFASLEQALNERDFILVTMKIDAMFDPLRGDPRFEQMSKRVSLP